MRETAPVACKEDSLTIFLKPRRFAPGPLCVKLEY